MKLGWGWKIAILYGGFMAIIIALVIGSSRQSFDLVSNDYYGEEIAYQKVIDASKNQSALSQPMEVHANANSVIIDFPAEFKDKILSGNIQFYSPVNSKWDRNFTLSKEGNSVNIDRSKLQNTRYKLKISCQVDGKNYYQESELYLHS